MYKIMFSAGETSGDLHGANLARALLKQKSNIKLFGFGGPQMESAGVKLTHHMEDYAVMGFWEVLINLRKLFKLRDELVELMKKERPDVLVLIDYPDFNWRLALKAKKLGIKIFSFIPPSAWAWRKGRAKMVSSIADRIVAIFPFEIEVYRKAGANISFEGNPLVQIARPSMRSDDAREFFGISKEDDNVVLLPGSRKQEIKNLLEPMLDASMKILQERPRAKFFLPIAPGVDSSLIEKYLTNYNLPIKLTYENRYDLMNITDFAIATSGTVTLEAALLGLPSIVLYKMSPVTYNIAKLFVNIKYFSLPNIIVGKKIIPELLQGNVNVDNILKEARTMYKNSPDRQDILKALKMVKENLGSGDVADRVAKIILELANN